MSMMPSNLAPDVAIPDDTLPTQIRPHRAPSVKAIDESTSSHVFAWRTLAWQAVGIWAATRVAYMALTYFYDALIVQKSISFNTIISTWDHWDSAFYQLASQGYPTRDSMAFFPLYPMLIAGLNIVVQNRLLAALVISNLAALGAFIGIAFFAAQEDHDITSGRRLLLTIIAYPYAFFLAAPYSESLFLCFAVFALFTARRGNAWQWATLMAILATLTRVTGIILILPLLWEYGRQHGWWNMAIWHEGKWRTLFSLRSISEASILFLAAPLAMAAYFTYLWYRVGTPFAYFQIEHQHWHPANWPAPYTFVILVHRMTITHGIFAHERALQIVTFGLLIGSIMLVLWMIRRLPIAFTLYMAGLILLTFSAPDPSLAFVLPSAGRYLLESLPLFLVISRWTKSHAWFDMLWIQLGFLLQAVFFIGYAMNIWIE
jgi:hypothetical protein